MRHKKIYLLLAMIGATSAWTLANENQVKASSKSPVYRLYNPNSGEHFYTTNFYEGNSLKNVGWLDEGIGWQAANSGAPVYRLYNPNVKGGDHYYTLSNYEAQSLVKAGWRWDNGAKPVFIQQERLIFTLLTTQILSPEHTIIQRTFLSKIVC